MGSREGMCAKSQERAKTGGENVDD